MPADRGKAAAGSAGHGCSALQPQQESARERRRPNADSVALRKTHYIQTGKLCSETPTRQRPVTTYISPLVNASPQA